MKKINNENKLYSLVAGVIITLLTIHELIMLNRWSDQFTYATIGIFMYSYLTSITILSIILATAIFSISNDIKYLINTRRENSDLTNALIFNIDLYLDGNRNSRREKYGD